MRSLLLIALFAVGFNAMGQKVPVQISKPEKDAYGIRLDAPKGVYQYAFRIGEWETISKTLKSRYEWLSETGRFRVYVAENGLTYVEEILDSYGKVRYKTTYDYVESTDSWENSYIDMDTGESVKFTSKFTNGSMVETIKRTDNENNNTYTIVADNVVLYTANRTYKNGFTLITHIGIATKITSK
ncbi:hypothetical protein [Flagellimonas sp.]|jgi:uncharacterized protein involved in high-affinity Fe2+ transport|uniref:hypothetical protein n=1 Tax=Flagellimonas sp. TaxID=2058762 RepID=UPI003BA8944D